MLCLLSPDGKLEMPFPGVLNSSSGTCHAMGYRNRRAEAHCQSAGLTWLSLCAPQLLTFLCKIAWFWPSSPDERPDGPDDGSPSSWALCQVFCGHSLTTITNKVRTIIFCFPSEKAEIRQVNQLFSSVPHNWNLNIYILLIHVRSPQLGPALMEH